MTELFHAYHEKKPEGFYATTHLDNKLKRKEISDNLHDLLLSKIEVNFENLNLLGGAFISKSPGQKGILPLHQDWNLVDESQARSYNLWIPLVDVNEENGAMRLLSQSHNKQTTFRGPNVAPILYQISKEVDKHMFSLNMKKGQAVLYDHALWHSSPENQTDQLRLALVMGALPQNAEMKYYHQVGEKVEEYASYPTFFFEQERDAGPAGLKLTRSFEHPNTQLSQDEFERIYLGKVEEIVLKKGFFQRIFSR
ncbi:MAG: phytanoyl-CoA dioxygenase family protein [Crocinitomicaceae bacterium]|nr:phytanoyl-CoA dioxygenase family protein [Crocinitomicaceae bacterium]